MISKEVPADDCIRFFLKPDMHCLTLPKAVSSGAMFKRIKTGEGMEKLVIKQMILGQVQTNCYLVMNSETKELIVIDPADSAGQIRREIAAIGGKPTAVLLTHGHFDHIGAADVLRKEYGICVYAQKEEQRILESDYLNLSDMFGCPIALSADVLLEDGQELELLDRKIRVFHTPGHTAGGACYYFEEDKLLFSGDTLFYVSVGRTDFPTGSMSELVRSVKNKLMLLPDDVRVLPGHNSETTIGFERVHNPYIV